MGYPYKKMLCSVLFKKMKKKIYKKNKKFRSIFTAFFAQKGVLNFPTYCGGQFLEYKDAVFCVCFRILIYLTLSSYFFRILPHFSKKLRSIPMIYFFEKEKNEKSTTIAPNRSH